MEEIHDLLKDEWWRQLRKRKEAGANLQLKEDGVKNFEKKNEKKKDEEGEIEQY